MVEDIGLVIDLFTAMLSGNEQKSARLRKECPELGQNDVRVQVLERMWHVGMAALACYVAQRDHFSNGSWWKNHVGFAVLAEAGPRWNQTIGTFIKLGWVTQSFSMMEAGFRVMLQAIINSPPPINFNDMTNLLFEKTGVTPTDQQLSALRLFQLTRNTIHNMGFMEDVTK